MAWGLYVAAGLFVAERIYRELNPDPKPTAWNEIKIPLAEPGSTIPIVYGRCRVRQPILAWTSVPLAYDGAETAGLRAGAPFIYGMRMMFVLGIPYRNGINRIHRVWAGDDELREPSPPQGTVALSTLTGVGNHENTGKKPIVMLHREADGIGFTGGRIEWLNGSLSQRLVDAAGASLTTAADEMLDADTGNVASGTQIPGYRGMMLATLYSSGITVDGGGDLGFAIGTAPQPPSFQFEVSSYPPFSDAMNVGMEMNPAEVLLDLLTGGGMGKLGMDASLIDSASFLNAKIRFQEEGMGYSRCITDTKEAREYVTEILEQVDGVTYEDPRTGRVGIKLIRPDYNVSALPHITPSNCEALEGFAAAGMSGTINKVRVRFPNRDRDYRDDEAVAHNQAVAFAEGAKEIVLDFPGVCTMDVAKQIASRELTALCRPLQKCTAVVGREFYTLTPGTPVKLTWPKLGLDARVFRVVDIDRGNLENGRIRLDLLEDFFYVWRGTLSGSMDPGDWGDIPPFLNGGEAEP
jgi:hypothetical protein